MTLTDNLLHRARGLPPGCFALVMATGIVSIDANQHGLPQLALALFAFNLVAFVWLLGLTLLRVVRFHAEVIRDFTDPARGAGFLTLAAAACVLGNQSVLVRPLPMLAVALATAGGLLWLALTYLFFAAAITARFKPGFTRSINGGWLVAVVATQALSALLTLLTAGLTRPGLLHLAALGLYMLGAALYLIIITLVVYRLVFFPLRAREFTPPYWINMGALAITTLAGSLIVTHAPTDGALAQLLPFVKGFTVFFWATATWWIPLLVMLEAWRHLFRRVPLRYETDDWDIVFPIGMYTVGTFELAGALQAPDLLVIPAVGVYASLAAWLLVALLGVRRLIRGRRQPQ